MDRAATEWLTGAALESLSRGERLPLPALQWLLRRYAHAPCADLYAALGPALVDAVAPPGEGGRFAPAERLALIAELADVSDPEDEALRTVAWAAATEAQAEWAGHAVGPILRSVDACLRALPVLADGQDVRGVVAAAIDTLEHVMSRAYAPGAGLACDRRDPDGPRGSMRDHLGACSALLAAYGVTDRLAYPMLAEEVLAFVDRTWGDSTRDASLLDEPGGRPESEAASQMREAFAANCEAARVATQLAVLHRDGAYREQAVVAPRRDYAREAGRLLARLEGGVRAVGLEAAAYDLALDEWLALSDRRDLQ